MQLYTSTTLFAIFWILIASDAVDPQERNVNYGKENEQVMDIYYPSSDEDFKPQKILLVVHGGGWAGGEKRDMVEFITILLEKLPGYYIANMNYRLGTIFSPGYPKQTDDIHSAIKFLRNTISENASFVLLGGSAGAHLSMLYSYSVDNPGEKRVKAVVNIVGPADLVDASQSLNPVYPILLTSLTGPCPYVVCPKTFAKTSPVNYVTNESAPTIGFYGDNDFLVPKPQMGLLQKKLDDFGVVNSFTMYNGGHYYDWKQEDKDDMMEQIVQFIKTHL